MKDKKTEQIASKKAHRRTLKASRREEPLLQRSEPSKIERPTILIVCEGENTETSYFKQFKLTTATIVTVGEGYNTTSLVRRAKKLAERSYEQVWCVFDADPKQDNTKQAENFNKAILLAEKYGFGIAYSNQAFEYWIILHLEDHQGGRMNRTDYNTKINKHIKPYSMFYDGKGSKNITEELFELLDGIDEKTGKERKILAIARAKRNYNLFDHSKPANEESTTTVFRLVEELMKYI